MDFDQAVQAHVAWKTRLRMFVDGQGEALDPATVGRDDKCALGQWIHGEGRRHTALPQFAEVESLHAKFHAAAAEVVKSAQRGDRAGATALLNGPAYLGASQSVVVAIKLLEKAVAKAA